MDMIPLLILALVSPAPVIAGLLISAIVLLVSGQAVYLALGALARKPRVLPSAD